MQIHSIYLRGDFDSLDASKINWSNLLFTYSFSYLWIIEYVVDIGILSSGRAACSVLRSVEQQRRKVLRGAVSVGDRGRGAVVEGERHRARQGGRKRDGEIGSATGR